MASADALIVQWSHKGTDMNKLLKERKNKFLKLLTSDAYISTSEETIRYLTGANGDSVLLLVNENIYLAANSLSYPAFKSLDKIATVIKTSKPFEAINQIIEEKKIKSISYQPETVNCSLMLQMKSLPVTFKTHPHLSETVRMVKDDYEIKQLRHAAIINRNAMMAVYKLIKPGITEKDIAGELEYQMRKFGSDGLSFPTIVATKKNAYNPHALPSFTKVEENDVVLIDFGAMVNGYHADQTYTFVIGKVDSRTRLLYNTVILAQYDAIESIREGMTACEIDEFARKRLRKEGLEKQFIHSTGHGVGLAIHELPWISPASKQVIKPNMVFTIEPGVYFDNGLGIRQEVTVLSHELDAEVLGFAPIVEVV